MFLFDVSAQALEIARLEMTSRMRVLSRRESDRLADLIRLERQREWAKASRQRRREDRLAAQRERALARLAEIDLQMGVAA